MGVSDKKYDYIQNFKYKLETEIYTTKQILKDLETSISS